MTRRFARVRRWYATPTGQRVTWAVAFAVFVALGMAIGWVGLLGT